jgi:putative oxidoreductase
VTLITGMAGQLSLCQATFAGIGAFTAAVFAVHLGFNFLVGGIIEFVCGILIGLGLLTRLGAFLASGEMAVAYFMMHAPHNSWPIINKGELAVVYAFLFLYIALRGGGSWSIDAMWGRRETPPA